MNIYNTVNNDPFMRAVLCKHAAVYGIKSKRRQIKHIVRDIETVRGNAVTRFVKDHYTKDAEVEEMSLVDFFANQSNLVLSRYWRKELFETDATLYLEPQHIKYTNTEHALNASEFLLNPFGVQTKFAGPVVFPSLVSGLRVVAHLLLEASKNTDKILLSRFRAGRESNLLYIAHNDNIYEVYVGHQNDGTYFLSADALFGTKMPKRLDPTTTCWLGSKRIFLPVMEEKLKPHMKRCAHPVCTHQFPDHYHADICGAHEDKPQAQQ